jgi:hypothetical protein
MMGKKWVKCGWFCKGLVNMLTIDWQKILPVIVSILIIIAIAILRHYSKNFAAIAATMPINIPLGMWIVYAGENGDPEAMAAFGQAALINIIPTVFFLLVAYLTLRAGWGLLPVMGAGYLVWGVTLGLSFVIRNWLGWS